MKNKHKFLFYLPIPLLLLISWEIVIDVGIWPSTLIAPPSKIVPRFFTSLLDGTLPINVLISLKRLFLGLFIGCISAILLGAFVGLSQKIEKVFGPTIQIISPIPVIAWTPILILLFKIDGARIALIAIGSFFILYFGTVQGIRSTDKALIELSIVYEKTPKELLFHVLIPSSLPSIFDAFRTALAICWILLLSGEVIASSSGLGWLIWNSRNFSRPDDMIVGMIAVGILGKFSDYLVSIFQKKIIYWSESFQGQ